MHMFALHLLTAILMDSQSGSLGKTDGMELKILESSFGFLHTPSSSNTPCKTRYISTSYVHLYTLKCGMHPQMPLYTRQSRVAENHRL